MLILGAAVMNVLPQRISVQLPRKLVLEEPRLPLTASSTQMGYYPLPRSGQHDQGTIQLDLKKCYEAWQNPSIESILKSFSWETWVGLDEEALCKSFKVSTIQQLQVRKGALYLCR